NPKAEDGYAGVLNLQAGQILSVSGDYERYYTINGEKYHHILNPQTGYPAQSGLCSVAVICSDGALADALSTALFVMGEEKARAFYESKVYDFEAVFIDENGNVITTTGLTNVFEIDN
ncbi:MAG: FAD:protein FMN transferase, partial [Ruminococcaceae bacterium]|nr:FAD:protein FMN transferase [Oscillospiraceae bacterium]